jgi:hypothetical protein
MTDTFELWIDSAHSKKNRTQIICPHTTNATRHLIVPSGEAKRDAREIARLAEDLVHVTDRPFFPDEDLSATMIVDPRRGRMAIKIEAIGERPRKFTGRKRDLHGHIDVPMDALQGIVFANDNQIAELYIRRILET